MESLEGKGGRYREPVSPDGYDAHESWKEHEEWVRSQPDYTEQVRQMDMFLNSISFSALHDIFEKESRQAQIERPMHWVDRDHISLSAYHQPGFHGMYSPPAGAIQIGIGKDNLPDDILSDRKIVLTVFHRLIHEYTHSVSGQDVTGRKSWWKERRIENAGFGQKHTDQTLWFAPKYRMLFDLFDEGVTETIAREVTLEYFAREPLTVGDMVINAEEARKRFAEKPGTTENPGGYSTAVEFVQSLVQFLETNLNVPKDIVWKGFKRGYLRGTLIEGEFASLLDKTVGSSFTSALSKAKKVQDLKSLAVDYDFPPLTGELTKEWLATLSRG